MRKSMHLVLVFAIVTLFSSTSTAQPYAHNWTERSAYGDSANYTWPPPDSTFVQNRIVMKFRPYVLNYDSLSYDCDTMGTSGLTSDSAIYFPECKKTLMAQKFTLQIVKDVLIRTELSNHGVTHLMRMTAAHPYLDTLSLTSIGDTIPMRHFDYVVAYLNNDTSVLSLLEGLYYFDSSGLEYAEPVYYGEFARTPADPFFLSQKSFSPSVTGIGMEDAWDYNRGDYAEGIGRIRVAVIDDGIDYFRCDLGSFNFESGLNLKVYGGWDYAFFTDPYDNHYYPASMEGIYFEAGHGTPIAGIIGAFTNDNACDPPGAVASGMAGIAGGWRGGGSWLGPQTLGAKLYGYNISYREPPGVKRKPLSDFAASAILEASSSSLSSKYGYNVDVINCSWFFQPKVPLVVREAISESFHHLVNFAACTGNDETNFSYYPAATENSLLVTGVGATRSDLSRAIYSNWFPPMDVVAPGGDLHPPTNRYPNSEVDQLDFSIMLDETDGHDYASGFRDVLGTFEGTSFATPHVAGAMALLRAFNYDHPIDQYTGVMYPEDYEGIIKASAFDIGGPDDPGHVDHYTGTAMPGWYGPNYDKWTGWGQLRPDNMFKMLDPNIGGYKLYHVAIPPTAWSNWSGFSAVTWRPKVGDNPTDPLSGQPYLVPGIQYRVKVRICSTIVSYAFPHLPDEIDQTSPVYVWGNHARGKTGLHLVSNSTNEPTLFGDPFAEVTSATGGLGNIANGFYHAGMRHEHSTNIVVRTYQYAFYPLTGSNPSMIYKFPSDDRIKCPVSIFGRPVGGDKRTTDVTRTGATGLDLEVWPLPTKGKLNVRAKILTDNAVFKLIDALGKEVRTLSVKESRTFSVDLAGLPIGTYVGVLVDGYQNLSAKVVLIP